MAATQERSRRVRQRRREVGFWPLLAEQRLGAIVAAPEFLAALIVGGGVAAVAIAAFGLEHRLAAAGDYLAVAGPLLGIVFAALALVVSLFSDRYLRLLNDAPGGLRTFLAPFMIALGLQVGALLGAVAFRVTATVAHPAVEGTAFALLTFVFFWAIFDVVALARSVLLHALNRARIPDSDDSQGSVRQIRPNNGGAQGGT